MRRFVDREGTAWDVVLGRESWGAIYALFVPSGSAPIRQAPLPASAYDVATQQLDAMSNTQLQQLLDESQLKPES
ncbi:MAG TPA: hypothetical protein VK939_09350 [Longimicrobiales bacterium]|nr:hypothetical protein [Longimicrobiales bacterium]